MKRCINCVYDVPVAGCFVTCLPSLSAVLMTFAAIWRYFQTSNLCPNAMSRIKIGGALRTKQATQPGLAAEITCAAVYVALNTHLNPGACHGNWAKVAALEKVGKFPCCQNRPKATACMRQVTVKGQVEASRFQPCLASGSENEAATNP